MTATIGAGPLWNGAPHPSGRAEYPAPYVVGTAIGEFLRVESLLRVAPARLFHLVNNVGPKWKSRKCWACGNRYVPDGSRICEYCFTPLRDVRMLMSVRWESAAYKPWEAAVSRRFDHFGLHTPVALYYRDQRMLSVHQYDGERFLMDEAAPWPADRLLTAMHFVCTVAQFLLQQGVVLEQLSPRNILVMPDDTVRLFDLDVIAVVDGGEKAARRHPSVPDARMVRDIAEIGMTLCPPEAKELRAVLTRARTGRYDSVGPFARDLENLYQAGSVRPVASHGAVMSDMGLVREHNEDTWAWESFAENGVVYMVADGMGGHHGGEIASRLACDAVSAYFATYTGSTTPTALKRVIEEAFGKANAAVLGAHTAQKKMGTTLVAAVTAGRAIVVANTGDSRAYVLRAGKLEQLSRDHTVGQELIDAGKLTKDAARTNPRANLLTASIGGAQDDLDVFLWSGDLAPGERVVLCSDGLWGFVAEPLIAQILAAHPDRRDAAQELVKAAIEVGAPDNVTCLVIDG